MPWLRLELRNQMKTEDREKAWGRRILDDFWHSAATKDAKMEQTMVKADLSQEEAKYNAWMCFYLPPVSWVRFLQWNPQKVHLQTEQAQLSK